MQPLTISLETILRLHASLRTAGRCARAADPVTSVFAIGWMMFAEMLADAKSR